MDADTLASLPSTNGDAQISEHPAAQHQEGATPDRAPDVTFEDEVEGLVLKIVGKAPGADAARLDDPGGDKFVIPDLENGLLEVDLVAKNPGAAYPQVP